MVSIILIMGARELGYRGCPARRPLGVYEKEKQKKGERKKGARQRERERGRERARKRETEIQHGRFFLMTS